MSQIDLPKRQGHYQDRDIGWIGSTPSPIFAQHERNPHAAGTRKAMGGLLKRDVVALWIAARDPRTPWYAKATAAAVAAYALSPIDLIPDFIPIIGYLDDLLIVPAGIALAIRFMPSGLMAEFRQEAAHCQERPRSNVAAVLIIAVWAAALAACSYRYWPW